MDVFKSKINNFTSTKVWYFIENIIIIGLLFYCIYSLIGVDNVYYQIWKNEQSAKAILAFTAVVFIIRKVKLFNWQSLVGTLLLFVVFIERKHFWIESPDIWAVVKPQMFAEWLSLMIVIDMCLYKNVNNLFKSVNYLAILYVLMTVGMIYRRNTRLDPLILIFPFFLFALVKMDVERKRWFTCRFIDAWFISFVYVVVKSFVERPYEGERYYGCFLNIGQFGIFMVCCFAVSISALYYCLEVFGKKNLLVYISCMWIIFNLFMLYIIDTRTIMVGVLFCLAFVFLFARKDTTRKKIIKRWVLIAIFIIVLIGTGALLITVSQSISEEWFVANFSGPLSPIATNLYRLRKLAEIDQTISDKNPLFRIIDSLSSGRLTIAQRYAEYFNFEGNTSIGFELEEHGYWVYTAHNTYIQFLVEYGYVSFAELMIFVFASITVSVKDYLHSGKQPFKLMPILWLASMIGVWLGEADTFFFPITFFGFMFMSQMLSMEKSCE